MYALIMALGCPIIVVAILAVISFPSSVPWNPHGAYLWCIDTSLLWNSLDPCCNHMRYFHPLY